MNRFAVLDLGFGDSGKGTTVDYLCSKYPIDLVIRFNGGAQACHTVVNDSFYHQYHTYGSATHRNIPTYLTEDVLVDPIAIYHEYCILRNKGITPPKLIISPKAKIVLSLDKEINKAACIAMSIKNTCGMGIGVANARNNLPLGSRENASITINDVLYSTLPDLMSLIYKEKTSLIENTYLNPVFNPHYSLLNKWDHENDPSIGKPGDYEYNSQLNLIPKIINNICEIREIPIKDYPEGVVYEGAQGFLLDEKFGQPGYNTFSSIKPKDLDSSFKILGITRSYLTRHGTCGSNILYKNDFEVDNQENEFQGKFKSATQILDYLKYSNYHLQCDSLVVTHCDRPTFPVNQILPYSICNSASLLFIKENFHNPGMFWGPFQNLPIVEASSKVFLDYKDYINFLSNELRLPVFLTSHGPDVIDKILLV